MTQVKENLNQIWNHCMEPPTEALFVISFIAFVVGCPRLAARCPPSCALIPSSQQQGWKQDGKADGQDKDLENVYWLPPWAKQAQGNNLLQIKLCLDSLPAQLSPFFPGSTSFLHPLPTEWCRNGRLWLGKWHSLSGAPAQTTVSIRRSCSCLGFPWTAFPSGHLPLPHLGAPWCESVLLWSLFMGSTRTPGPPRLLPNLPQAWSALTPGELPSPHLKSPQGCLFLFFFPRSSLLCSGKANLSSQRDGKKTHIHSLPHKSQAISLPEIIT